MSPSISPELVAAVSRLATRRPLLLAFDFDGVLAPIVEWPDDARALPGTLEVLRQMGFHPDVTVALVSGRSRGDLRSVTGVTPSDDLRLVGSHGAELDEMTDLLDTAARGRLQQVRDVLEQVAAEYPGAHVEDKPSAAVLHTRQLTEDDAASAVHKALNRLDDRPGVHLTLGKSVVEVAVIKMSKGTAVQQLRDALRADAVLYVGDDVTDETVFTSLRPGDLSVKVGDGDTAAQFRIDDPEAVRELTSLLLEAITAS